MFTYTIEIKNVAPSDGAADYDAIASLWDSVGKFFTDYKLSTENGYNKITVDVQHIRETLLHLKPENCDEYFSNLMTENNCLSGEDFYNLSPLGATLRIHTDDKNINIDRFLQQFFLAMNLSHCGSCNLIDYTIIKDGPFSFIRTSTKLTSSIFDDALAINRNNKWPQIQELDFSGVWKWLEEQDLRTILLAKTPAQKACAMLVKLSLSELHYAELLLAITQVLESVLLKNSESKSYNLGIKIEAILGQNPNKKNWVKKMYNIRSSIIHGEHDMLWPYELPDLSSDSEEEQHIDEINESFELGASTVVALVQDLIQAGKIKYNFTNKLHVEKI
ncbi:MAG: hypothetical protein OEX19_02995 [Gammaproteobacteria bacterium]|nr:hypothetical protein [Gammaproteobacteria bacterium]